MGGIEHVSQPSHNSSISETLADFHAPILAMVPDVTADTHPESVEPEEAASKLVSVIATH